ncbi:MAG: DUF4446 family protein [Lachnospiraceae bacterium]|jgi:hypothetical protein|nr:DUF4446 family protein [Lachnospiraceae bacterium]
MENSILNKLPFDPVFLLIGLGAVWIVVLVLVIILWVKTRKMYRRYDTFMRGRDATTLEDHIMDQMAEIADLKDKDKINREDIRSLNKQVWTAYQKFGMVKYNAFKGMGGNLSFAFAILNANNTGFILNAVHSRDGCYMYMKLVDKGQTDIVLGNEEREALEQALGY